MVDYAPVLNRAVAALDPNTPEARRAIYDRARQALVDGLRSSDPTLSDTDLRKQSLALEGAIRQVEAQYEVQPSQHAAPPSPRVPPVAGRTPPPVAAPPVAAARDAAPEPDAVPEPPEPPEPDYDDPAPLDDDRKPIKMMVMGGSALAVLLLAALAYNYWPARRSEPAVAQKPQQQQQPAQQQRAPVRRVDTDTAAAGSAGYMYLRQPVYYRTNHPVGTIVVDKSQSFLYVVRPSVSAIRYGIGVGPECNTKAGLYQVVRKEEWPGVKAEAAEDARNKNPFGARALYLSKDNTRIHGTNAPSTIGRPATLGCFRLTNDDVIHLYERSPLDTRVVVLN